MRRLKRWLQIKLIDWIIYDVFNGVKKEDILKIKNTKGGKVLVYKDKELDRDQTERMIESAEKFEESDIWKVLKAEVRYRMKKRIYEKSKDEYDIVMGKMGLHIINLIEDKIKQIRG